MRVKLKDVCTFYTGTGFPKKYQGQLSGTYPFYKVGDIANNVVSGKVYLEQCNNYISEETLELIKGSIIPKNTIVFAKIGEALKLNRRAITSTDCLIDNNAMGIAAKSDKLRTLFFYYFMKNIKMELLAESTTVPSVRKSRLEAYEIDIPSLDEQKIIEGKLTILSKVINLKEKQLLKLDELVKARFVEMFGDPVVNDKKWEIRYFSDLGELKRGKSKHRPRNDPILLGGKYPLIQTGDVTNSNTYIKSYTSTYSEEGLKQSKMWKKGTLCITIAANIAESAILTFDACFPDSVVGFTPNGEVISLFIHYWLSFLQPILEENAPAVAQKNLNVATLEKVGVIVPPLELQNQFASFVQEIDKSRSRIQKSLEASQELFDSLMQEYFG